MTVHEVCALTGVSIRTLQYYDEIGLLPPAQRTGAGCRLYDAAAPERLQQILLFREEPYCFLSNFFEASIAYNGLVYGSSEAAFQAQKCMTEEEKLQFTELSPGKSKSLGRRVRLRPDREQVKLGIMEQIVRAKFTQHPELAARLLETGDKVLVEGNRWGDTCWGVDLRTGQGENHLGRILMKVRKELKQGVCSENQ